MFCYNIWKYLLIFYIRKYVTLESHHVDIDLILSHKKRKAPQRPLLRSLRFSERHLCVASETVILGLQTKGFFIYLFIYLQAFNYFAKLKQKVAPSLV